MIDPMRKEEEIEEEGASESVKLELEEVEG